MSEAVVAKRYADALFQLATEKNTVQALLTELETVKAVFVADKKVVGFLNHPRISMDEKAQLIDNAFGKLHVDVVNTLKILVERGRINIVQTFVDRFVDLYNEANDIAAATVYSVRTLSEGEIANLTATLKTQLNKQNVSIENIIDPSIIGGVKIKVGNTIYDGSVSNKLNRLKQNIVSVSN